VTGTVPASIGLGAGVAVLGAVGLLLHRTLTPTLEITRYADSIADTVDAIASNVRGGAEIARTRELALGVPGLAGRLLEGPP
jgi:hypothetical protein